MEKCKVRRVQCASGLPISVAGVDFLTIFVPSLFSIFQNDMINRFFAQSALG